MKTTHRFYSEEAGDFRRLCRFIVDHNDAVRAYSTWCIGRLVDWKYGLWENKTAVPEADWQRELLFYNHSRQGPIYHPQTDLCVMAPDGRLVSGCEALIDAHNGEVDIERVCTHSAFRKRGFARAVIQECLYRLRDMGLRKAHIAGYSPEAIGLYGSLGDGEASIFHIYETASH